MFPVASVTYFKRGVGSWSLSAHAAKGRDDERDERQERERGGVSKSEKEKRAVGMFCNLMTSGRAA